MGDDKAAPARLFVGIGVATDGQLRYAGSQSGGSARAVPRRNGVQHRYQPMRTNTRYRAGRTRTGRARTRWPRTCWPGPGWSRTRRAGSLVDLAGHRGRREPVG
jgi:hypothetical protein